MKILVICQRYWPESFQITAVCEDLVRRGHEVTVLTGLPNYPSGSIPCEYRMGKNRIQAKDGVKIVRSFEIGRRSGVVGLACNYYSYSISASRAASKLNEKFDVVFAYQLSPVLMAKPAVVVKRRSNTPLLLYCCDLWPESMKVLIGNKMRPIIKHFEKVSRGIYQAADTLVVQSPAFAQYFSDVHNIPLERICYVPHFSSDKYIEQDYSRQFDGTVNFVFTGNIGRAQNIPCILKAIAKMQHTHGFMVHFVGDGACLNEAKSIVAGLAIQDRVVFYGRQPFSEMSKYYRIADACLLTLDGSSWIGTTLPSKLQGYMAAGKPIIGAVNGGARAVIEESNCGRVVAAGDIEGLAALMDECVSSPKSLIENGLLGREYFKKHFMRNQHIDKIESLLKDLCERNNSV